MDSNKLSQQATQTSPEGTELDPGLFRVFLRPVKVALKKEGQNTVQERLS